MVFNYKPLPPERISQHRSDLYRAYTQASPVLNSSIAHTSPFICFFRGIHSIWICRHVDIMCANIPAWFWNGFFNVSVQFPPNEECVWLRAQDTVISCRHWGGQITWGRRGVDCLVWVELKFTLGLSAAAICWESVCGWTHSCVCVCTAGVDWQD